MSTVRVDSTNLQLATANFAALWSALGETREHPVIRRPGFLAVAGSDRTGLRVLLLESEPTPTDLAELIELVRRRRPGLVTVEDPFSRVELTGCGLTPRQLPIMIRQPARKAAPAGGFAAPVGNSAQPTALTAPLDVRWARCPERLAVVEDVVVRGFPMETLQPYQPGEAFPAALLDRPGMGFHLVTRDGAPVGACLTVTGEAAGLYWMTTLPEHRSRGVGRALLNAVLDRLPDRPMVLTAARAGRPLYESLGFEVVGESTWWS